MHVCGPLLRFGVAFYLRFGSGDGTAEGIEVQ